jgi:hypothetical protein
MGKVIDIYPISEGKLTGAVEVLRKGKSEICVSMLEG